MALPASPIKLQRGSCYGADGIYYPAEEERVVPLTEQALRLIAYLYYALRYLFRHRDEVHVGADQFIYWEPGNVNRKIAPDGFVIQGVPRDPPRAVIRLWEEAVPDLVIEISSAGSRSEDRGNKLETYQNVLRCPEYLIYDEDLDEMLFFRLEEGVYRLQAPAPDGRVHSSLGFSFAKDRDVLLRVYGADGEPVPESEEWIERYQQVQQHLERERRKLTLAENRAEAERERAEAERERAESERERAVALEQEIARLRELLKEQGRS